MSLPQRHAVVIGAGIGGLLAARVLRDHVDRVTIVDRDRFPDESDHRGGVPQSQHVHGLLPRGVRILSDLFPGLESELRASGAAVSTDPTRAKIVTPAGLLPVQEGPAGVREALFFSRPLLEWHLRRRLAAEGRVRLMPATEVVGLIVAPGSGGTVVGGVRVRSRDRADTDAQVLDADLVVDASGRRSHVTEWLDELGYPSVREETMHSQLSYASRFYVRPDDFPDEFSLVLMNGRPPESPRAGLVQDIENGVWHATLAGLAGTVPPTDDEGFLEFARELPDPTVYEALRVARPLTPIRGWRTETNRLRHFEELARWPTGLIVTGDAVCSLNPMYGQGMTVSAMDAEVLRDCLADRDSGRRPGFELTFQRRLARSVSMPWMMASSEDLRWPGVTMAGATLGRGARLARRWLDMVLRAAVTDPVLAQRYFEVIGFLSPVTSLFTPRTVARVLARTVTRRVRGGHGYGPYALSPDGLERARELPSYRADDSGSAPVPAARTSA